MELFSNPLFALFVIIALGFIVGNIKIRGFSFGISAVLFVALLLGHFGVVIPQIIERIGMVLFIFTVGIQAGPGFFESFKKRGRKLAAMAALIVISGVLVAFLSMFIFDVDAALMAGILCGALTSTPGLTVAIDATSSPLASIGYGIAYPMGVVGVIVVIKFIPKILKLNLNDENKRLAQAEKDAYPKIESAHFIVKNDSVVGKTLSEIEIRTMTGATVSRIQHKDNCSTPLHDTILNKGDIIRAVGSEQALAKVEVLIGEKVQQEITLKKGFLVQQFLITNKKLVGKSIHEVSFLHSYNAVVTRINRGGIDIAPSPDLHIRFGDKLTIGFPKASLNSLTCLLGNNERKLSDTDFLPIALGIVIGILLGYVSISFSSTLSMSLGLSGGVLLAAIALSNIGKTGPIVWIMSDSANQLLRQLGLLFFLSAVGTKAGGQLVDTLNESGIVLLLIGFAITILPMLVALLLNKLFFKFNVFELMGAITGGMTSTPGLAACDSLTDSNLPGRAYAAVYPIAMVILIICVQFLAKTAL